MSPQLIDVLSFVTFLLPRLTFKKASWNSGYPQQNKRTCLLLYLCAIPKGNRMCKRPKPSRTKRKREKITVERICQQDFALGKADVHTVIDLAELRREDQRGNCFSFSDAQKELIRIMGNPQSTDWRKVHVMVC